MITLLISAFAIFCSLLVALFSTRKLNTPVDDPLETPPEPAQSPQDASSTPSAPPEPSTVPEGEQGPVAPDPDALLPWDMTGVLSHNNWHNVRALCDRKGLHLIQSPNGPWTLKEELCATVWGESEFKVHLVHPNYVFNKETGAKEVSTTDYGIAQWNDYWHGKEISPDVANNDPVTAINLMADYFKAGRQNQWCAHSNGSYKQHIGRSL